MLRTACGLGSIIVLLGLTNVGWTAEFKDAVAALQEKNYTRVVEVLDEYIKEHPKEIRAYALRGRALAELREFERAIPDLNRAISVGPDAKGIARHYRGRAYLLNNPPDLDKALEDLTKAIEIDPEQGDRYYDRGMTQLARGDKQAAFDDVHKAVGIDPENVVYYIGRGDIQMRLGCEEQAVQYLVNGQPQVVIQLQLKDREKVDQAIADFTRALERNADSLDALQWRIRAYRLTEEFEKLVVDQKEVCRLQPENPTAWNDLGWILATSRIDAIRNGKEAIEAAEKACELTKYENVPCLDTLAAAYAEAKRFKKAVSTQQQAIERLGEVGPETKKVFQDRLELYEQKKPYREGPEPAGQ